MQALLGTSLRVLTWCGIISIAILSLLPGNALRALSMLPVMKSLLPVMKSARTILPSPLEHFVVFAVVAAIGIAGYGLSLGGPRIIAAFCVYAGALEFMRHFSPGRHPSVAKFAGSALGALCGGLVLMLLFRRYLKQPS